jgi:hypothetical protein
MQGDVQDLDTDRKKEQDLKNLVDQRPSRVKFLS